MKAIRRRFCKLLSFVMIFCFLFTTTTPEIIYGEQVGQEQNKVEVLSNIFEIQSMLKDMGLSLDDFKDIPQKTPEFYAELEEYICSDEFLTTSSEIYISKGLTTPPAIDFSGIFKPGNGGHEENSKYKDEFDKSAQMMAYAEEMARINKERDRHAKSLTDETVYMYMSHYIDRTPEPVLNVEPWISDDAIFAAWITERDRKVYDNYLSYVYNSKKLKEAAELAVSVAGELSSDGIVSTVTTVKQRVKRISDLMPVLKANVLRWVAEVKKKDFATIPNIIVEMNTIEGWNENFNNFFDAHIEQELKKYDDPRAVAESIKENLKLENYNEWIETSYINIGLSLVSVLLGGGFIGLIASVTTSFLSFDIMATKDIIDSLRWKAMVWTLSERSAERSMRYFGFSD